MGHAFDWFAPEVDEVHAGAASAPPPRRTDRPPLLGDILASTAPQRADDMKIQSSPQDLAYAAPYAEVDGVPTGQKAHPDDDGTNVASTETTVKGPVKHSSDQKKYGSATAANHTVERSTTTTTTEGNTTDVHTSKTAAKGNWDAKTAGMSRTTSHEHKVGEGPDAMSATTSKTGGIDVSKTGATAGASKETMVKAGDSYHGGSRAATAGYKDGQVVVDLSSTAKRGAGGVGGETTESLGYSDGQLTGGVAKKRERVVAKEVVNGVPVARRSRSPTA
jgi:hypothetical protein